MDWSVFTDEELRAISKQEFEKLPTAKLKYYVAQEKTLKDEKASTEDSISNWDAFTRQAERSATQTPRMLSKVGSWISEKLGGSATDIDLYNKAYGLTTDAEREGESRVAFSESPIVSFAGALAGAAADPVNLMSGAGVANRVAGGASPLIKAGIAGAVSGAVGGALTPTYEEYDDSIVKNTLFGTVVGGSMGTVMGMMGKYLAPNASSMVDPKIAAIRAENERRGLQRQNMVRDAGDNLGLDPARTSMIAEEPGYIPKNYDPSTDTTLPNTPTARLPEDFDPLTNQGGPSEQIPVTWKSAVSIGQDPVDQLHPITGGKIEGEFIWYDETKAKLANIGVDAENYKSPEVLALSKQLGIEPGQVIRRANSNREWAARFAKVGVFEQPRTPEEAIEQLEKVVKAGLLPDIC